MSCFCHKGDCDIHCPHCERGYHATCLEELAAPVSPANFVCDCRQKAYSIHNKVWKNHKGEINCTTFRVIDQSGTYVVAVHATNSSTRASHLIALIGRQRRDFSPVIIIVLLLLVLFYLVFFL